MRTESVGEGPKSVRRWVGKGKGSDIFWVVVMLVVVLLVCDDGREGLTGRDWSEDCEDGKRGKDCGGDFGRSENRWKGKVCVEMVRGMGARDSRAWGLDYQRTVCLIHNTESVHRTLYWSTEVEKEYKYKYQSKHRKGRIRLRKEIVVSFRRFDPTLGARIYFLKLI